MHGPDVNAKWMNERHERKKNRLDDFDPSTSDKYVFFLLFSFSIQNAFDYDVPRTNATYCWLPVQRSSLYIMPYVHGHIAQMEQTIFQAN